MKIPNWRKLVLTSGVLAEPIPDENRIVLWVPGRCAGGFQHWERISTVPAAEITVAQGLCAIPATSIPARQRVRGLLGKLFHLLANGSAGQTWILPNGQSAEQCGERQTDLLIVWTTSETKPLDEALVASQWPQRERVRKLGENLFLVSTIVSSAPKNDAAGEAISQGCPRKQVEQLLAQARENGEQRNELLALTDLGVIAMRQGDPKSAVTLLERALTIARGLGEGSLVRDAIGNLGVAHLGIGQAPLAIELFQQELADACGNEDRFAEKTALDHLGLAHWCLRDYPQAFTFYEQAVTLARQVDDWQHEAELLWYRAILHAELSQRQQAIAYAQATVDLLRKRGKPQVAFLEDCLHKYRREEAQGLPGGSDVRGSVLSAGRDPNAVSAVSGQPAHSSAQSEAVLAASGPGLLRMASSALKSMIQFVGSGCQTVSSELHQQRLQTCAGCEQFTGVRCRSCGCFTDVKAWLSHEECPQGKWLA